MVQRSGKQNRDPCKDDLPVRARNNAMPLGKDGYWKVVISKEKAPCLGLKEGQIIGFQAVIEGDPAINLSERFLDIITAKESISEILRHYFAHCPSQNAVDDPHLALFFNYQTTLASKSWPWPI
jgi:NADH oxidase (H2O2-forming)